MLFPIRPEGIIPVVEKILPYWCVSCGIGGIVTHHRFPGKNIEAYAFNARSSSGKAAFHYRRQRGPRPRRSGPPCSSSGLRFPSCRKPSSFPWPGLPGSFPPAPPRRSCRPGSLPVQVRETFQGKVGVYRVSPVAHEKTKMVNLPGFPGLEDNTDLGPFCLPHQMMVHRPLGKQHTDRNPVPGAARSERMIRA